MSDDDSSRKVISGKELARQIRKAAYVRAKEQRAKDPRYLAMKEAARQQRRDLYQRVKAQRKAEGAAEKARTKLEEKARKAGERAAADRELLKAIGLATGGKPKIPLLSPEPSATSDAPPSEPEGSEPESSERQGSGEGSSDPDESLLLRLAAFAAKGSAALN